MQIASQTARCENPFTIEGTSHAPQGCKNSFPPKYPLSERDEIGGFVSKRINNGTWEVVLQFVPGLLELDPDPKKSSSDIFIKFLPVSTKKKNESELMLDSDLTEPHRMTCWPARKEQQLALNLCQ